jgi:PKD domain
VLGVLVAPAQARIVLDKNIDGVRPGMTAAKVRQRLGKPAEVNHEHGAIAFDVWTYGRSARSYGRVYVLFLRHGKKLGGADTVGTLRPSQRAANGVHVGMTLKRLRTRMKGLVCKFGLCFTHDPTSYDGIVTRFVLGGPPGHVVVSKVELVRVTPPKPKAPPAPRAPRPAAEGGPNVARDFIVGCPCWPHSAIGFDVKPLAHEDHSYALVQNYNWDFGDGTKTSGWYESAATHEYQAPGTYTVTLTMVDEEGSRWYITKQVEVRTPRPASESPNPLMYKDFEVACADESCTPGSGIFFNLVYAPADEGSAYSYPVIVGWDFGDGTLGDGSGSVSHTYSQPGTYAVTVTMADGNDEWYVTKQVQITG